MALRLLLVLLAILPGACAGSREADGEALRLAFTDARTGFLPAGTAVSASGPGQALVAMPAGPRGRTAMVSSRPMAAAQLLGAGSDAVRRWWGEPAFRRIEGEAEVWRYDGPACALDLLLYPELGGLRVAHAAARASGIEARTEAACLGGLGQPAAQAGRLAPMGERAVPGAGGR